jgi:hypothetical protein
LLGQISETHLQSGRLTFWRRGASCRPFNLCYKSPTANTGASARGIEMKKVLIVAALMSLIASEANAVVYCAAGPYRAGCVARPGVRVGVVHPYGYHPYGYHPYAHPYVRRY